MSAGDPFLVPGAAWSRVSPRLTGLRRVLIALTVVAVVAGAVVLAMLVPDARTVAVLVAVATLLAGGWSWWFVARSVAAWGWVERDNDLVVARGRVWRRLDVVPYGRMQLVDVTAGPLQRAFGLTTVRMHTASPSSQAYLPGLPAADAERLREQLTERGEAQAAGL